MKPFERITARVVPYDPQWDMLPFVVYTREQLQRDGTYKKIEEWTEPRKIYSRRRWSTAAERGEG